MNTNQSRSRPNYIILSADNSEELCSRVNGLIEAEGYTPVGGVSVVNTHENEGTGVVASITYYQAMYQPVIE